MSQSRRILCVHGVGHGDADVNLQQSWTDSITTGLQSWDPEIAVTCDFLSYDDLFDQAPLNPVTYGSAFARLLASGVSHGIGDLFSRERGLFELPDAIRWTAGMVAQWVTDERLRKQARLRAVTIEATPRTTVSHSELPLGYGLVLGGSLASPCRQKFLVRSS